MKEKKFTGKSIFREYQRDASSIGLTGFLSDRIFGLREKLFLAVLWICIPGLGGCISLPGQEPFGETTFSEERAGIQLEEAKEWFAEAVTEEWDYSISFSGGSGNGTEVEYYRNEVYPAAAGKDEEGARWLWYQGRLFRQKEGQVFVRDMTWEEMGGDRLREEAAAVLRELLEGEYRQETLSFQYIPMAGDQPYLLTVDYPRMQLESGGQEAFFDIRVTYDREARPVGISLQWNTIPWEDEEGKTVFGDVFAISMSPPVEGSYSLQAEREIWFFGKDAGLTSEVVPALEVQREQREKCLSVIESMDFTGLTGRAADGEAYGFPAVRARP